LDYTKFKRKDEASKKIEKKKRKLELCDFVVEDDDIKFLNGPYIGKTVREIWEIDKVARDWVINKVWVPGDASVREVIKSLLC